MLNVLNYLRQDLKKYYLIDLGAEAPTFTRKIQFWLSNWGFHCVLVYRLDVAASSLFEKNKIFGIIPKIFSRFLTLLISLIHHVEILADIGPGLYISHASNIYIGRTVIGANFSVTHNVTIGQGLSQVRPGIPKIGKNVWVGTGSVLYGNISVGHGVTIIPCTLLTKDIPDNCLIGGNPARVVKRDIDNRGYFAGFYVEQ